MIMDCGPRSRSDKRKAKNYTQIMRAYIFILTTHHVRFMRVNYGGLLCKQDVHWAQGCWWYWRLFYNASNFRGIVLNS